MCRLGVQPSVESNSVIMNTRQYGGICPLGLLRQGEKIKMKNKCRSQWLRGLRRVSTATLLLGLCV